MCTLRPFPLPLSLATLEKFSFQVVVENNVDHEPLFFQAKQPQLPQLLHIKLTLQTLHQLLWTSSRTSVSFLNEGNKNQTQYLRSKLTSATSDPHTAQAAEPSGQNFFIWGKWKSNSFRLDLGPGRSPAQVSLLVLVLHI